MKKINENILLFSNFGINEKKINIHDPDSDYNILNNDSISSAIATENSSVINNVNKINKINLFMLDELALEGAKLLANKKEKDLDYESSEIASVTTGSTEGSKYLLNNCKKTEMLTPCVLLYIVDGQVQWCSNYKQKTQRPLAQLVGSWEIDSEALKSVKNDNKKQYALGICRSHYSFDQNVLHDANHKSLHCIDESIGKKLFTCNDKHKNDTIQALELIGQWILNMAKSNNSDQKDELLTYLIFRLGQVNLAKIMKSDYNLTYKVSKKFGKNLGTAVWKSRDKDHRIQALLLDYIGDIIAVSKDRNVQFHIKAVWKLADDLTIAFQLSNPATYKLFEYSKEINEVGFSLIATCYAE
ncbi:14310_t:CDS:2, partial [Gigaspora margarita]